MTFSYFPNVPNGPDDPADDQPLMQTNTASISSLISVDHVGFNVAKGGLHNQVTFSKNQSAPGFGTGVSDLFANVATGNSWPFWQNAIGTFQMVNPIMGSNANGSITIPGGLIFKFGFVNSTSSGNVAYATPFPTGVISAWGQPYFIGSNPNGNANLAIKNDASFTAAQFSWVFVTNSGAYSGFFWYAIGV